MFKMKNLLLLLLLVLFYSSNADAQIIGVWPNNPPPVIKMVYVVNPLQPVVVQEMRWVPVIETKVEYVAPAVYYPVQVIETPRINQWWHKCNLWNNYRY
jgi:hypothetical protein